MRSVAKHGYAVRRLRTLAFSDLAGLVREAITNERYFLSPRMNRLKSLLAKLDPASAERTVTPYPAPRPSAEPSLLYRKLKGGRRR